MRCEGRAGLKGTNQPKPTLSLRRPSHRTQSLDTRLAAPFCSWWSTPHPGFQWRETARVRACLLLLRIVCGIGCSMGGPYKQVKLSRTKFLDRIVISLRVHITSVGYEVLGRKKARAWRAAFWLSLSRWSSSWPSERAAAEDASPHAGHWPLVQASRQVVACAARPTAPERRLQP